LDNKRGGSDLLFSKRSGNEVELKGECQHWRLMNDSVSLMGMKMGENITICHLGLGWVVEGKSSCLHPGLCPLSFSFISSFSLLEERAASLA